MTVRVVTAPQIEPVSLAEMKTFLRETQSVQDDVISLLITTAREYAESYTQRAFVTQTLELLLPFFPCSSIVDIPRPPLQSIESIKYIDVTGVLQTVDPADYQVDYYSEPGRVKPAWMKYWQVTRNDFNAVQIRYVAGYPAGSPDTDAAANVPASVKQWMKVRVAQLYENREAVVVNGVVTPLPRDTVDGILDPLVCNMFGSCNAECWI